MLAPSLSSLRPPGSSPPRRAMAKRAATVGLAPEPDPLRVRGRTISPAEGGQLHRRSHQAAGRRGSPRGRRVQVRGRFFQAAGRRGSAPGRRVQLSGRFFQAAGRRGSTRGRRVRVRGRFFPAPGRRARRRRRFSTTPGRRDRAPSWFSTGRGKIVPAPSPSLFHPWGTPTWHAPSTRPRRRSASSLRPSDPMGSSTALVGAGRSWDPRPPQRRRSSPNALIRL